MSCSDKEDRTVKDASVILGLHVQDFHETISYRTRTVSSEVQVCFASQSIMLETYFPPAPCLKFPSSTLLAACFAIRKAISQV